MPNEFFSTPTACCIPLSMNSIRIFAEIVPEKGVKLEAEGWMAKPSLVG